MVSHRDCTDSGLPNVVSVGTMSKPQLLEALGTLGVQLNQAAMDLFADARFEPNSQAADVKIAARSLASLGFSGGATYAQIVARAQELGLTECPLELAAYLRLQSQHQVVAAKRLPNSEPGSPPGAITIASKPLDDSDETPKGFYLRNIDGTLWLRGYRSDAIHVWSAPDVFVFAVTDA